VGTYTAAGCWARLVDEAQVTLTLTGKYFVMQPTSPDKTILVGEHNYIVLRHGEYLIYSFQELQSLHEVAMSDPDKFAGTLQTLAEIKADLVRRK
jgi:hypothetical protein